jgi:hypothetical protein
MSRWTSFLNPSLSNVISSIEIRNPIDSFLISHGAVGKAGALVDNADVDAGENRPGAVGDRTSQVALAHLGVDGGRDYKGARGNYARRQT